MAKARRERHSIEARVEREKAAVDPEAEAAPDDVEDETLVQEVVVDEPPLVEQAEHESALEPEPSTPVAPDQDETPTIDQDTAVALAVQAARPDAVSRVVDPIRVASDALDREDAEAEADADAAQESSERAGRPRDAVSASLSDRAAAQLAKRRRREEERAAREADKSDKTEKSDVSTPTAPIPAVVPAPAETSKDGSSDRVRQAALTAWEVPEPRAPRAEEEKKSPKIWSTVVSVVGIIGYVCAVLLAVGAMTVALGLESGDAIFDLVSPLCDVLVSPARGLVSFSGDNAETKELFLAYSVGSVVYLVIGLVAQNLPKRQD